MIDLVYFFVILLVFIAAYSIAGYAILFPNSEFTVDQAIKVMRFGYWNIFGEPALDTILSE